MAKMKFNPSTGQLDLLGTASDTNYSNTSSGLTATNVQAAIDEVASISSSSKMANYEVTTAFVSTETFVISTGAGGVAGVSTPTGDNVVIGAWLSSSTEYDDNDFLILFNGVELIKNVDYTFSASDTITLAVDVDIDDYLTIKARF